MKKVLVGLDASPRSSVVLDEAIGVVQQTGGQLILLNAYNDPKAAIWLSGRVHTPLVVLPYSVGGSPEAKDLFGLFDDTVNKLLAAGKLTS